MPLGEEARAREFYADILGFEEVAKPKELVQRGGAWFRSGIVHLHLGVDPQFHPAIKAHPALRCSNYAALVERLRENGVKIIEDAHHMDGAPHCYIADPFGNRIELIAEDGLAG
jgi:catechol 2,3-dioxygenase-like lactoylglutathione lyase family enzyme